MTRMLGQTALWRLAFAVAAASAAWAATAQSKGYTKEFIAIFVPKAKAAVTRDFMDPESARFRGLYVSRYVSSKYGTISYLCGEVNAKNAYGAYVGFRQFASAIEDARVAGPEATQSELEFIVSSCANKVADVR
jgi:hypothetical protein